MSSAIFYLDESGDLGWTFNNPYRHGGSSRFLTIATVVCPSDKKHLPKRLIKSLYSKFGWKAEKKWKDMLENEKKEFILLTEKLLTKHIDIKLFAITVAKEKVFEPIKRDENLIYNYMIKLSLIDEIARYDNVTLIPDPRTIKVKSGNSLHDYLRIGLAFEKGVATILSTQPCDSACSIGVQFADMIAGLVQNHFEDSHSMYWIGIRKHLNFFPLFFYPAF